MIDDSNRDDLARYIAAHVADALEDMGFTPTVTEEIYALVYERVMESPDWDQWTSEVLEELGVLTLVDQELDTDSGGEDGDTETGDVLRGTGIPLH